MPWPTYTGPPEAELRRLYLDERLTCRRLAARYGVSHMSIKRWLRRFDIPRRAAGRGLDYRGVNAPTARELERMVHHQHMSYKQIASIYGVDHTAVPYWLKKHGIRRPTIWGTRRKGRIVEEPSAEEVRNRYGAGESLQSIANDYDVSSIVIKRIAAEADIPLRRDGWQGGRRWSCADGHLVRSSYERQVDDWLYQNGFRHEIGPRLPFDRRCSADFLVNGVYIEVWGVTDSTTYDQRRQRKVDLYRKNDLPLVELPHWIFAKRKSHQWPQRLIGALS